MLPTVVFKGMVAEILADTEEVKDPISTGLLKLPFASDNCAVKVFPLPIVPVTV